MTKWIVYLVLSLAAVIAIVYAFSRFVLDPSFERGRAQATLEYTPKLAALERELADAHRTIEDLNAAYATYRREVAAAQRRYQDALDAEMQRVIAEADDVARLRAILARRPAAAPTAAAVCARAGAVLDQAIAGEAVP